MTTNESGGDVEDPVAEGFGFGTGEVTGEADELGPGEQIRREECDGGPCLVAGVVLEWRVEHPVAFPAAHAVLNAGA